MKKPLKKNKLSVIILNRNTESLLKQCLLSIPKPDFQIIVVDNQSTDNSVAMVRKNFPDVQLIESSINLGYGVGNNLARDYASGEYVLFLNSDTKVFPGTLETMLKLMESNQQIGVSTCAVYLPNGKPYYASHRGFPTPLNSLLYFLGLPSSYYPKYKKGVHEIDACSGTFLLIRRDVLDKINWFDEDYYAYGEDIEMCYQVKKLGFKVVFNPDVKILHYWGASSGLKSTSKEISSASAKTQSQWNAARYEAMKIFYDKHYQSLLDKILRPLIFFAIDAAKYLRRGRD